MGDGMVEQQSSANLLANQVADEVSPPRLGGQWSSGPKSPDSSSNMNPPSYSTVVDEEDRSPQTQILEDDEDDIGALASSTQPLRMDFEDSKEDDFDDSREEDSKHAERGSWGGRFDFLLSLLGYSVGLGNVWRFPYLAYKNGGGAFLIPFIIMLFLVGIPLMFMEMAFGQYASLGPTAIFGKFCPLFWGLGFGMVIISGIVALYYNVILAWTLYYIVAGFTSELPWERCNPEWCTHKCYSFKDADACHVTNGSVYFNNTCFNATVATQNNLYELAKNATKLPPAQEYFENHVLEISGGMDEMGMVRWQLFLCLMGAWTIVFLCLSKGVKSFGKVAWFTALFPYVVLVILFFRGVTLPGAGAGVLYYVTPQWHRLANSQVWVDAAVQIFFSLSPAWGGLIALASYNKFHNNCFKDALIVSIGNISTSIFAGIVIFTIVGYLAHELEEDVENVVEQGAGLAFMVYPEVVTRLPISPLWSFLFFFMLLTLGMGSMFATSETVTTSFVDIFPRWRKRKVLVVGAWAILGLLGGTIMCTRFAISETCITGIVDMFPRWRKRKYVVVAGFAVFGSIIGLVMCTKGGMYMLQLMDTYAASWSVFLFAILESVLIGWVYGYRKFCLNIEEMIGKTSRHFKMFFAAFWMFISPATLTFLLVFNWVQYKPLTYGDYVYPTWANAVGWVITLLPITVVLSMTVYKIHECDKPTLWQKIKYLLKPTADWGPHHKKNNIYVTVRAEYTP